MKQFLLLSALAFSATTAFAQICKVDLINKNDRIVKSFESYGEPTGCIKAMKECRKTLQNKSKNSGSTCVPAVHLASTIRTVNTAYAAGLECKYFDGKELKRGWHAFKVTRNYLRSFQYYGNDGALSKNDCINDLLFNFESESYKEEVTTAAATTCECKWSNGVGFGPYGWHMKYQVQLSNGKKVDVSSRYYSSDLRSPEKSCQKELKKLNNVCPTF